MPPAGCASPSSTITSAPPASSRRNRAGAVATSMISASGTSGAGITWPGAHLDLLLGSINTTVLLLSSVTCQLGVFAVERGQVRRSGRIWQVARWGLREWYVLTFLMGLYFVCGQGVEYVGLMR